MIWYDYAVTLMHTCHAMLVDEYGMTVASCRCSVILRLRLLLQGQQTVCFSQHSQAWVVEMSLHQCVLQRTHAVVHGLHQLALLLPIGHTHTPATHTLTPAPKHTPMLPAAGCRRCGATWGTS